ncbi:MAG: Hsp70 family protein [Thermodesulfobacteriota bacterium]|nr:Hsp70 family protein [Thermodesulfobacteriota bacterium]
MSKSIGIDLGTTNSVAAIKKVHTEVLKNKEGDFITPSCVTIIKKMFRKPDFVVGKHALEWMKQDPENTITAVKRLMGRNYNDKEVQQVIHDHRIHYQLRRHSRGSENSLAVILDGQEFTPEEISAKILEKIKNDARESLNSEVRYAVITVPSYFNDKQKHGTRTAAALTGLKVRRLLPEPTAAAISFGVDNVQDDEARTVLVFDFGGGTFDLSVLTISGGQFIEQGKGGDMWLGGEDVDRLITDYVLTETGLENGIEDIKAFLEDQPRKLKNRFLGELKAGVEKAKIRLSESEEAYIEILGILRDEDGDAVDVDVKLTRDQFNTIIEPMIDSIIKLTRKIINDIHFTPDLIDNVLLVGGSSRIPRVIEAMEQEFGKDKVMVHERPMLAIAEGAAILSHRLADTFECPECGVDVSQSDISCAQCGFDLEKYTISSGVLDIVHSAAHDYYIQLENNERHLLVEQNTPLPCTKTEVFKLVHPEQKLVHMKFYNVVNDEDESIGDLWLGIDSKYDLEEKEGDDVLQVELTLNIDENNLVEVSAAIKENAEVQLSKTLSRGKADEKLFLSLEKTITEANDKKYKNMTMIDLLHRALSVIRDINKVVDPETNQVNEALYNQTDMKIDKAAKMAANDMSSKTAIYYAEAMLEDFSPAISSQHQNLIRKNIKRLEEMDEKGTYEENVKAEKELQETLRAEELGPVNLLMDIQNAGEICLDTHPDKAPKFFKYIRDILKAVTDNDHDKTISLFNEIMPEASAICKENFNKTGAIYKDIRK